MNGGRYLSSDSRLPSQSLMFYPSSNGPWQASSPQAAQRATKPLPTVASTPPKSQTQSVIGIVDGAPQARVQPGKTSESPSGLMWWNTRDDHPAAPPSRVGPDVAVSDHEAESDDGSHPKSDQESGATSDVGFDDSFDLPDSSRAAPAQQPPLSAELSLPVATSDSEPSAEEDSVARQADVTAEPASTVTDHLLSVDVTALSPDAHAGDPSDTSSEEHVSDVDSEPEPAKPVLATAASTEVHDDALSDASFDGFFSRMRDSVPPVPAPSLHRTNHSSEFDMSLSPDTVSRSIDVGRSDSIDDRQSPQSEDTRTPSPSPAPTVIPVVPPETYPALSLPAPSPPPMSAANLIPRTVTPAQASVASHTPFSVRSVKPVLCSVSLANLVVPAGTPSPQTVIATGLQRTMPSSVIPPIVVEDAARQQLVATPVQHRRRTLSTNGSAPQLVSTGQRRSLDHLWPEPVSKDLLVSPAAASDFRRQSKSPSAKSSGGYSRAGSTFTGGVVSVRSLPPAARRSRSVAAINRASQQTTPLHDATARAVVNGQPNLELLERLKLCLAMQPPKSATAQQQPRRTPLKRKKPPTSKSAVPVTLTPLRTNVVLPTGAAPELPGSTTSAMKSPIKSPLVMPPPNLPSPWAVVESSQLRQQLVDTAKSLPVPITPYDNQPPGEIFNTEFKARPYHPPVGSPQATLFPHFPDMPDSALPVRDPDYRRHMILSGSTAPLCQSDAKALDEARAKIVEGTITGALAYNSVWDDVVQLGMREGGFPGGWSGPASVSTDGDGSLDLSSTRPTVPSVRKPQSVVSMDTRGFIRRVDSNNTGKSDDGLAAGFLNTPAVDKSVASRQPLNTQAIPLSESLAHEFHLDDSSHDEYATLDAPGAVPDTTPLHTSAIRHESSLDLDSSSVPSDNQHSIVSSQLKGAGSYFENRKPSWRTTQRRRRRRKQGDAASTVSTKSRRSVDSLADAALAVMSKNKDFLSAMKDELDEVERRHSTNWQKALLAAAKEIRQERGEKVVMNADEMKALALERSKGKRHSVFESIPTPASSGLSPDGLRTTSSRRPPRPFGDRSLERSGDQSIDRSRWSVGSEGVRSPPPPPPRALSLQSPSSRSMLSGDNLSPLAVKQQSPLSPRSDGVVSPGLGRQQPSQKRLLSTSPVGSGSAPAVHTDDDASDIHTIDDHHSEIISEVSADPHPQPACGCAVWVRKLFRRRR